MTTVKSARALPVFFMGKKAANRRITQFMASKHQLLSTALGQMDTRAIWYSFKHFEDLYKELVFLNADGIRIYLGEYESGHADFPGQLCLVMVPTRLNGASLGHEDIILEEESDFSERPGSEFFSEEPLSKAYNYGSPCPPVCPIEDEFKYPFNDEE